MPARLPSEILAEEARLPAGLLEELLEIRAYMQAYQMTESANTPEARKQLPKTPLFQLVKQLTFERVREEREQEQADAATASN